MCRLTGGRSKITTVDWFNLCRDVCCTLFDNRNKMDDRVVQDIDESLKRSFLNKNCFLYSVDH